LCVGFQASVPDCMKPDPVAGATKAPKQPRKKTAKKSSANRDADWVPELEEVSLTLTMIIVKIQLMVQLLID